MSIRLTTFIKTFLVWNNDQSQNCWISLARGGISPSWILSDSTGRGWARTPGSRPGNLRPVLLNHTSDTTCNLSLSLSGQCSRNWEVLCQELGSERPGDQQLLYATWIEHYS